MFLMVEVSGYLLELETISEMNGIYALQENYMNGFPTWKCSDKGAIIWYNKMDDHWSICKSEDFGSSKWMIAGPNQRNEMPNDVNLPWRYNYKNDPKQVNDQLIKSM